MVTNYIVHTFFDISVMQCLVIIGYHIRQNQYIITYIALALMLTKTKESCIFSVPHVLVHQGTPIFVQCILNAINYSSILHSAVL